MLPPKATSHSSRSSSAGFPVISASGSSADFSDISTGAPRAGAPRTRSQKRFPFPSNLRRHVSAVHLKERPFACAECHKSFATQRNLELHVRIRHRDELPHQCHLCSYRCHLPADLRKHLESHARGRRLGCRREDLGRPGWRRRG